MKKSLITTPCAIIGLMASGMAASQAVVILNNGNFENVTAPFPQGWTLTSGTPTSVAGIVSGSSSALNLTGGAGASNQQVLQDMSTTAVAGEGYSTFQFDMAFRISTETQAHRIRLEGNNGADLLSIAFIANAGAGLDKIQTANGGTLTDAFTGLTIDPNTTYYFRVTGTDFGTAARKYTLGLSTDGVNYTTSGDINFFHGSTQALVFETVTFEGGGTAGANFTIDNVSVSGTTVPEPSVALLGGLGLLGLLRRRRA